MSKLGSRSTVNARVLWRIVNDEAGNPVYRVQFQRDGFEPTIVQLWTRGDAVETAAEAYLNGTFAQALRVGDAVEERQVAGWAAFNAREAS